MASIIGFWDLKAVLMFVYSIMLLFSTLVLIFFLNCSSLLTSLVILEVFTFLVLWLSVIVVGSHASMSLTLALFCLFILESVLGLVGLLNIVGFSGSDYVKIRTFMIS